VTAALASGRPLDFSWRTWILAVLTGGIVAGTVDIHAACLINHVGPTLILKIIASGLFGFAALHGGNGMVAAGLALQWAMSLGIAAVFGAIARGVRLPRSRWILAGLAYGPIIFAVMSFVVIPLSAAVVKHAPAPTPAAIGENLLAMLLFGLIVAGAWAGFQPRPGRAQRPD
jgi:hypothetical protein